MAPEGAPSPERAALTGECVRCGSSAASERRGRVAQALSRMLRFSGREKILTPSHSCISQPVDTKYAKMVGDEVEAASAVEDEFAFCG